MGGSLLRFLLLILLGLPPLAHPEEGGALGLERVPSPALSTQDEEGWEGDHLYRVVLLRAAPGRQLDLIELLKEERDLHRDGGEPLPYWMRHTQGDQWDLMILYPIGSFHEYYDPARMAVRDTLGEWKGLSLGQLQKEADLLTSYREELFVKGPTPDVMDALFAGI